MRKIGKGKVHFKQIKFSTFLDLIPFYVIIQFLIEFYNILHIFILFYNMGHSGVMFYK
jgi:hypothetical protein